MKKTIEKTYGKAVTNVMKAVNPFKKKILNTHCNVHKYVNVEALNILNNEGYDKQYNFYVNYIDELNEGAHWIDQDFKSTNHFYHITKERGLYGFSNALTECIKYHNKSIEEYDKNNINESMFFLGACCHLIQDVTVPHHVDNRLLKKHRPFEIWIVKEILQNKEKYAVNKGSKRYGNIYNYIKNNANLARQIYYRYQDIEDEYKRYSKISKEILGEAQRTTAGFLLDFYEQTINKKDNSK